MAAEATIRAERALLPGGWARNVEIRLSDGLIAEVRRDVPGAAGQGRVMPAMANLHDRSEQRVLRKIAGGGSDASGRRLHLLRSIGPEELEALLARSFMEMMEAGWAAVGLVHALHHGPGGAPYENAAEMSERVCAAARTAGIGLTLLPEFRTWGGARQEPLPRGAERTGSTPESFLRIMEGAERAVAALGGDARLGFAPLRLPATTADELSVVLDARPEGPVHMQVARTPREASEVLAAFGARPVTWLLNLLGLDARWCLVHANQMTPAESAALAASGATLGLCPLALPPDAEGVPEAAAFLRAGGHVGLGADDGPLQPLGRVAAAIGHAAHPDPLAMPLYPAFAHGSARAIGRPAGEIAPGLLADLAVFDDTGARLQELWSAGRRMVVDGRHVARARILPRAQQAEAGLRARL